ncbi:hypothetical protein RFM26_19750 [Mesorhizobium sp. VK23B]|uniref:Uncharacterized protein n=1 Tax=Mesorhizobium dulcispinae TaxID=3072316 RepID=A0ABU4XHN0_9HYPH|nr:MULTISPECIES: hypothetical protein [unclassified Mesorhizobium]MDX8467932.1 hypothetical protein [Mesorhizobium sp. VK23B]MDX8474270.1 hypothetical protein [Mesorhizobium sp. VK23A]
MSNHLAGFYADNTDLALLGGMTIFVLIGVCLLLRRIFVAAQRRHLPPNAYLSESRSVPLDEASWAWDRPSDPTTEPASSQVAVPPVPGVRPQDLNNRQSGVRNEYFDTTSEADESSPGGPTNASATLFAMASPPRVHRPTSLALRLSVAAICLAVPLGYAVTRQSSVESAPAISQADSQSHPDLSRAVEVPASAASDMRESTHGSTSVDLPSPAAKAQVEAALAQAAAARDLAGQEHRAMEGERTRSASLQSALLESRKQIDALKTSMAAAGKAGEERLRNELAATRALDALQWIAQDVRALLGETINYVFVEMPAARLERQRTKRMARDLSQARAQILQLEAKAAEDRTRAEASLTQASGILAEERRKSKDLRGDIAEMELSKAAIAATAEQERTGAATARERVEQTAAETAQALAREQASAASTQEDLNKARLERDAAEQERAKAIAAKERAEQTAAETTQALERERASAVSVRQDLDKARLERDAAEQERARAVSAREQAEQTATATAQALQRERALAVSAQENLNKARLERDAARDLLGQAAIRLKEALDKQREATVSLARELAAVRADNDKLRAERRDAQIEQPAKPRSGLASAGTDKVKVVSQKTTRSKVRNPSRVIRVRSITLPYSLRPRHSTLD